MLRPAEGRYASGYRIRELRTERGWTQAELGRRAGVSEETVKYHERRAATDPHSSTLAAFASALDVSLESLFR